MIPVLSGQPQPARAALSFRRMRNPAPNALRSVLAVRSRVPRRLARLCHRIQAMTGWSVFARKTASATGGGVGSFKISLPIPAIPATVVPSRSSPWIRRRIGEIFFRKVDLAIGARDSRVDVRVGTAPDPPTQGGRLFRRAGPRPAGAPEARPPRGHGVRGQYGAEGGRPIFGGCLRRRRDREATSGDGRAEVEAKRLAPFRGRASPARGFVVGLADAATTKKSSAAPETREVVHLGLCPRWIRT